MGRYSKTAAPPPKREGVPEFVDLYSAQDLQERNPHVFPSMASLRWFTREHRQELIESGACLQIVGRTIYRGSVFVSKALEIGQRRMAERTPRPSSHE